MPTKTPETPTTRSEPVRVFRTRDPVGLTYLLYSSPTAEGGPKNIDASGWQRSLSPTWVSTSGIFIVRRDQLGTSGFGKDRASVLAAVSVITAPPRIR